MEPISLSPSKLNLFRECQRCFHDAYAGNCPRPRGIMASLPGGMDLILKAYVDQYRGALPPGLESALPGKLFSDMALMKKWRFWKTGLTYLDPENQIKLIGALDDCLVDNDIYIPLDWKTKGSEPEDDGSQYYQTQLDCYNLMLNASGKNIRNEGWLVYVYPKIANAHKVPTKTDGLFTGEYSYVMKSSLIQFGMKPFKLICDPERAREIVTKAAECLRGPRPKSPEKCEHCRYLRMVNELG